MLPHHKTTTGSPLRIFPSSPVSPTKWKVAKAGEKLSLMGSPLNSPTLSASAAKFRNKVPTQVKRVVTIYLGIVCLIIFLLNTNVFSSSIPTGKEISTQQHVASHTRTKHTGPFPNKIWQTWKVDPLEFEERDLNTARTWVQKNPDMRYEVLTDANEMTYVEEHYGPEGINRPDIIDFYCNVKLPIIKADLLRYMIMYADGGLYADIDVEALKPVHRFIPERYNVNDVDLVVGVEIDEPSFHEHPILGQKSASFCQWTIYSRPGVPVMLRLIENIMSWLNGVAKEQAVALGDVKLDFYQVISGTGPSAFTKAILEEMNKNTDGPRVTWDMFHDMDESKIVGRVLVLNVEAFCAGQGHSNSGNHNSRGALVRHHFHASNWPSKHPRYSHPAYGPVEACNWNVECVNQWDKDVAEFEHLAGEEKRQRVADRHGELVLGQ